MKAFDCWTLTLLGPSVYDSWPLQLVSQKGHQLMDHELAWTNPQFTVQPRLLAAA